MKHLHPYWRMEYIEAPKYPAEMRRPFSELPALGDDRAALIVHRSRRTYLILNRFPYNPGHLLAVPTGKSSISRTSTRTSGRIFSSRSSSGKGSSRPP
jgi:hypothetical protein